MSKSRPPEKKVPTGSYCYGYEVAPGTGFRTMAEVIAFLNSLPLEKAVLEFGYLARRVPCPYRRNVGHGRVRCKLTGSVAPGLLGRSAALSNKFYRKHPKALRRETGWLLADAVKACNVNRDGPDFGLPSGKGKIAEAPGETVKVEIIPQ